MTAIGFDASDADEVGTTQEAGVIKLAILAIGGQGGGVITDWIVATAERNGWLAQSTSVPGVAQRTGATIYYVEMAPGGAPVPVMALAPAPGDVDIVVAAELMEAGRAVQRGFVTPETTTLIASTHRAYGILEKSAPGDGIGDAAAVTEILLRSAKRLILADMETLARDKGSVISASLFGALAAAAVLPFSRESYEQTIRDSGKGVTASLAAFAAGWRTVRDPQDPDPLEPRPQKVRSRPEPVGTAELGAAYHRLVHRIETGFPEAAQEMLLAGLEKVVDYQDIGYGRQYLDRVAEVSALDAVDRGALLTVEAAKYVANAMAYDDVIRRPEDAGQPCLARSRGSGRRGEPGSQGDGVHAPPRRGSLRVAAEASRRFPRGAAEVDGPARPAGEPGATGAHRHAVLVSGALYARRLASLAPPAAASRA